MNAGDVEGHLLDLMISDGRACFFGNCYWGISRANGKGRYFLAFLACVGHGIKRHAFARRLRGDQHVAIVRIV